MQGKICRFPRDTVVMGRKTAINKKKTWTLKFPNSILNQVDALQNKQPKLYWKLINDLKDKSENSVDNTDPETWTNHFRNLHYVIVANDSFTSKILSRGDPG